MTDRSDPSRVREGAPAPWLYLFGVLAWTWTWLGIAASTGRPVFSFPTVLLLLGGGAGPVIVPVVLIRLGFRDPALDPSVGAFFRRAYDPRSLSLRWYLYILGLVGVVAFGPVLVARWMPGADGAGSWSLISVGSSGTILIGILGGVLEETGWRGYAQEGLQRRMPVLVASLVVGIFWGLWHLPLFLIEGTYQSGLGLGTAAFWSFHLGIIAACPLYAWLYNVAGTPAKSGGGRSAGGAGRLAGRATFAAVVYHSASNVGRELVPDVSNVAEVGVEAVVSLVVLVAAWSWMKKRRGPGPREADRRSRRRDPRDSASS